MGFEVLKRETVVESAVTSIPWKLRPKGGTPYNKREAVIVLPLLGERRRPVLGSGKWPTRVRSVIVPAIVTLGLTPVVVMEWAPHQVAKS